jgi:Predicted membrane protein
MNLGEYRAVFIVGGLILVLVASAPTVSLFLPLSREGERFSELWVLGPGHMAEDYPFNVRADLSYLVYVGVGNHIGSSMYYNVVVKFRNQSEPLPNATTGTPSPLPPLYEYCVFLEDGESWEAPVTFSFSGVSFSDNQSLVEVFKVNEWAFGVDKVALWDAESDGYYYQVFIELWIYNTESDRFQYHNRFVYLLLNMTGV